MRTSATTAATLKYLPGRYIFKVGTLHNRTINVLVNEPWFLCWKLSPWQCQSLVRCTNLIDDEAVEIDGGMRDYSTSRGLWAYVHTLEALRI